MTVMGVPGTLNCYPPGDARACQVDTSGCVIDVCATDPSLCTPTPECGNGSLETGEACDDQNTTVGDGCAANCSIEPAWNCVGTPSICGHWVTGNWSGCSQSCGDGTQSRTVSCESASGSVLGDTACLPASRPAAQQACSGGGCCVANAGEPCTRLDHGINLNTYVTCNGICAEGYWNGTGNGPGGYPCYTPAGGRYGLCEVVPCPDAEGSVADTCSMHPEVQGTITCNGWCG